MMFLIRSLIGALTRALIRALIMSQDFVRSLMRTASEGSLRDVIAVLHHADETEVLYKAGLRSRRDPGFRVWSLGLRV